MKLGLRLMATIVLVTAIQAEDLTTSDGKSYKNIRVTGETVESVKILHDGGISLVPKNVIPGGFFTAHELTPPPQVTGGSGSETGSSDALIAFQKKTPTFKTRDGREFQSAEITKIEPDGIKLVTASGIVKIKFDDLPTSVKTGLDYDPAKAEAYATEQRKKAEERAEMAQRLASANSHADSFTSNVRLQMIQYSGKGWLCSAEILEDRQVDVVTSRAGSPLSGPKVLYETTKKTESVVVGTINRVMVFGLPAYGAMSADLQSRRQWSGRIYRVGFYRLNATTGRSETIVAAHNDRVTAISWLSKNGNAAVYTNEGDIVSDEAAGGVATGTGFAITDEGHIATAAHVVEDGGNIEVVIKGEAKKARVLAISGASDVAILKIDDTKTKPLPLWKPENVKLGADLICVGFPLISQLGVNPKLTKGTLNALSGLSDDGRMIQMSVQIQPGNSGGPVCDAFGRVIAVVSLTSSTIAGARGEAGAVPQNVNFAMKADMLMKLAESALPKLKWAKESDPTPASPEEAMLESTYLIRVTK